ncbi:HYC_CC_PP family protein [Emticicia sp. SJ17W-69]|uniref:HYC_CC_PP family protein n=1 Tax=Emticicia sp. SJ17W-69 TaxID=3421657 RepID=UPI003EBD6D0A
MKKVLFRTFNVMMAVVVLLSSTGFGLVEHSCTVRGKQTSLHKSGDACCGITKQQQIPQKTTIKKSKCCSEDEKYENVEYSSSASQLVAKFAQNTLDWVKSTVISFTKTVVEAILENISSANHSSASPPSGREILAFIQSYLI